MADKYYIHFETKPSFAELDQFFELCKEYEPVMATSYYVTANMGKRLQSLPDYARQCFPRYRFVICKLQSKGGIQEFGETGYVKTDLVRINPPSAEAP